ncbi:MAG: PQQ-binding-like beta-propeller repeat protein, partial [Blastopirellula sp. JB062]
KKRKKYQKKPHRKNRWDSPLLLFGGAGLVMLALAGGLLFAWLSWDSGDSIYQLAEEDYEGRKYAQAVSKYDKFLASFPSHSQAPTARVRRGLANLRLAIEGTSNYEQALQRTTEILEEMQDEPEFALARPELASLLPDVAHGLAQSAIGENEMEKRRQLATKAREAMRLVDDSNYLPTSLRSGQQTRIDGILADIQRVERGISRDEELATAVAEIQQASEKGDFEAVYRRRLALLRIYPSLSDDPRLQSAVREVVASLEAKVTVNSDQVDAIEQDHPLRPVRTIMIATRNSKIAPQSVEAAVTTQFDGAIYGLDRRSGAPLWRRFLGFPNNVEPVSSDDGAALIAFCNQHQELVKLNALTGELIWRFPLDQEVVQLLPWKDDLIVVARAGNVLRLKQDSGRQSQRVDLPQQTSIAAIVGKSQERLLVVGEHSTLYELDATSLQCNQALFLGHESGAIVSPPIMSALGHLCLFENAGVDFYFLDVLGDQKDRLQQLQAPTRLPGLVLAPALAFQSRVAAANDRGAIFVFEGGANEENPVRLLAQTKAQRGERLYSLLALENGHLWVGDNRLSRYALQLSQQSIVPRVVEYDRDNFISVKIAGDLLIHARRPSQGGGVIVSAVELTESGVERRWETTIAAPLTGPAFALAPQESPLVMTSRGDLFELTKNATESGVADVPSDTAKYVSPPRLERQVEIATNRRLFLAAPPDNRAVYFDAARSNGLLKQITLEVPSDSLRAGAVVAGDGIVAPSSQGQVFYLKPNTGAAAALPFQPRLALGENLSWNQPAVDGDAALIFDGRQTLYRLRLEEGAAPQLASVAQCVIPGQVGPKMAVSGLNLAAKIIGESSDELAFVSLPDLQSVQSVSFDARLIAGPFAAKDLVIVQTSLGALVAYGADQQERWRVKTEESVLVGAPVIAGNQLIGVCDDGRVLQIAAETGEVLRQTIVDEPLVGGAALHDGKLWLNGYGGVVHVVDWK